MGTQSKTIWFILNTKAEIEKNLADSKKSIEEFAARGRFRDVARSAISAESSSNVLVHMGRIEGIIKENSENPNKAFHIILDYISNHSTSCVDDKWSGRENDIQRSIHDQVMDTFTKIREAIVFNPDYAEAIKKFLNS